MTFDHIDECVQAEIALSRIVPRILSKGWKQWKMWKSQVRISPEFASSTQHSQAGPQQSWLNWNRAPRQLLLREGICKFVAPAVSVAIVQPEPTR